MKKLVIGAVALVIISQALSTYYLTNRFRLYLCNVVYRFCEQRCDDALRDTLDANNGQRILDTAARQLALTDCVSQHAGDGAALTQCTNEVNRVFDERRDQLNASDATARERRARCGGDCGREAVECRANALSSDFPGALNPSVSVAGTVKVDCIEGGAPCYKPVSDFCQRVSGVCDQCLQSLCGGGEWTVETVGDQLPLETTLMVATDPSKNPRVLVTSIARGNQAVLNVPSNIKLGEGEQLYFGFSSQKKPGGPVEVRIQRSK